VAGARRKFGSARAVLAATAVVTAGWLDSGPAHGQGAPPSASPEIAAQKAAMLEGFFASERLRRARESNPERVAPLEAEARAELEAGQAALKAGQPTEAAAAFDSGIRAISRAVSLGSAERQPDQTAESVAFLARRRQAESYISALERADDTSAEMRAKLDDLRGRLARADRDFAVDKLTEATESLGEAFAEIVKVVSDIRRGHSVFVSRIFDAPEAEFDYERARNADYRLLVNIALAERSEEQPSLAALAARLTAESERTRDEALQQAGEGAHAEAIKTMERSTEHLLAILRAAGLIMME